MKSDLFENTLKKQSEFGHLFRCTHAAVLKWEKHKEQYAKILPTTEVIIRLYVFAQLHKNTAEFKNLYDEIDIPKLAESSKIKEIPQGEIHCIDNSEISILSE